MAFSGFLFKKHLPAQPFDTGPLTLFFEHYSCFGTASNKQPTPNSPWQMILVLIRFRKPSICTLWCCLLSKACNKIRDPPLCNARAWSPSHFIRDVNLDTSSTFKREQANSTQQSSELPDSNPPQKKTTLDGWSKTIFLTLWSGLAPEISIYFLYDLFMICLLHGGIDVFSRNAWIRYYCMFFFLFSTLFKDVLIMFLMILLWFLHFLSGDFSFTGCSSTWMSSNKLSNGLRSAKRRVLQTCSKDFKDTRHAIPF